MAGATGLEPATSGVTGRRSNQLSYAPAKAATRRRADALDRPCAAKRQCSTRRRRGKTAYARARVEVRAPRTSWPLGPCAVNVSPDHSVLD